MGPSIRVALQGVRMPGQSRTDADNQARAAGDAARRWQDVVELAQAETAGVLLRALALGRFDRVRYQNWLAMESVLCRIGALSLDAVASWHGSRPALQQTVADWAARLREDAHAASHDIRLLDGMAQASPRALAEWHAFASAAGSSQRAGEVLGAVLLHERLSRGPMEAVLATVATLPFGIGGQYLKRRLRAAAAGDAGPPGCDALLDAYAAASLALGAQRGASWHAAALAQAVGGTEPAP